MCKVLPVDWKVNESEREKESKDKRSAIICGGNKLIMIQPVHEANKQRKYAN